MSPGDYGVLLLYFKWIRGPARSMGLMWVELQYHAAGLRRVFALMDMPGEEDLGHRVLPRIDQRGEARRLLVRPPVVPARRDSGQGSHRRARPHLRLPCRPDARPLSFRVLTRWAGGSRGSAGPALSVSSLGKAGSGDTTQ